MTEQLLHYLREPTRFLVRVDEELILDDTDLTRRVANVFEGFGETAIIDVLRPRKGHLPRLDVVKSSRRWRRLTHDEHEAISRDLISLRFSKFLLSIDTTGWNQNARASFWGQMLDVSKQLSTLPSLAESDADALMSRLWVTESQIAPYAVLAPMAGREIKCNIRDLRLLYQLCRMFSNRYLVLIRLDAKQPSQAVPLNTVPPQHDPLAEAASARFELTYTYHQNISQSPDRDDSAGRQWWTKSFVRAALTQFATSVRIHVPLAKKTSHYSAEFVAPQNYFFWRAIALTDVPSSPGRTTRQDVLRPPLVAGWASTVHDGRCAALFIRGGHQEKERLYIAAQMAEEPSLSASHTAVTTTFTFVLFLLFAGFAGLADHYKSAWAALVVAVLGMFANTVREETRQPGLFRTPLQARLLRISTAFLTAFFASWLICRGSKVDDPGWVAWLFDLWFHWGGVALTLAMLWLSMTAWRRVLDVMTKYKHAIRGRADKVHLYGRTVNEQAR